MNRFNGFSFHFQNELNIMETVKTVGIHCIGLPRPRSWAEVKKKSGCGLKLKSKIVMKIIKFADNDLLLFFLPFCTECVW